MRGFRVGAVAAMLAAASVTAKGFGQAIDRAAAATGNLLDTLTRIDIREAPRPQHGGRHWGRKGKNKNRLLRMFVYGPTPSQLQRSFNKQRWLEGKSIPDADRLALERAKAERERKNAKRARMHFEPIRVREAA